MAKIYVIMGKSSSGKDTIYNRLKNSEQLNFHNVIMYTTRPMREGEEEGKEYFFTTDSEVSEFEKNGKIIELRAYNTVHGIWKYFTLDDGQIDLRSDKNYLIIATLEAYKKYVEYYGRDTVVPIYIEVEDKIRIHRALAREDMQEKHKALFVALGAINNATDNLRKEISPRLGEYATRIMEIMTDNKYTSFDVSDGLKVTFTDKSGAERSIDFLSGGTKDMTYIAVRAALIDMLYPEKPPICFDESFAHQDNVRASAMMRAIKYLADEGCQSFIFTCRGREASLATEIVKGAGVYKLS